MYVGFLIVDVCVRRMVQMTRWRMCTAVDNSTENHRHTTSTRATAYDLLAYATVETKSCLHSQVRFTLSATESFEPILLIIYKLLSKLININAIISIKNGKKNNFLIYFIIKY